MVEVVKILPHGEPEGIQDHRPKIENNFITQTLAAVNSTVILPAERAFFDFTARLHNDVAAVEEFIEERKEAVVSKPTPVAPAKVVPDESHIDQADSE